MWITARLVEVMRMSRVKLCIMRNGALAEYDQTLKQAGLVQSVCFAPRL